MSRRLRQLAAGLAPRVTATAALTAAAAVMSACGPSADDKADVLATPEGAHVQAWIDVFDAQRRAIDGIHDEPTTRAALPELTRLRRRKFELNAIEPTLNPDALERAKQVLHDERLNAGKRLDYALRRLEDRYPPAAEIIRNHLQSVTPATAPA